MATKPWEMNYSQPDTGSGKPWEQNFDPNVGSMPEAPQVQQPAVTQQQIQAAQQAGFAQEPALDRFLGGMGQTMHPLFSGLPQIGYAYMTGGPEAAQAKRQELAESMQAFESASKGDFAAGAGQLGSDIGLTLIPGAKIAGMAGKAGLGKLATTALTGAGIGAESAAQHQLQNVGAGGQISPLEAGVETGLSTVLPVGGSLAKAGLKKVAPDVLWSAIKPPVHLRKGANPVTEEKLANVLKKKHVKYFNGLEKATQNVDDEIVKAALKRDEIIVKSGIKVNPPQAIEEAKNRIMQQVQEGTMDVTLAEQALGFADESLKNALVYKPKMLTPKHFAVKGEQAVALRKLADDGAKWNKIQNEAEPPKAVFNRIYRKVLNDQVDNQIRKGVGAGNVGAKVADRAKELTKEMSDLIPVRDAMENRMSQAKNNYAAGLLDFSALGVGGGLGAVFGGENAQDRSQAGALGALGLLAGRRLTSTPGGARMLYDMSQIGEGGFGKAMLPLGMQTGRSAIFRPTTEE